MKKLLLASVLMAGMVCSAQAELVEVISVGYTFDKATSSGTYQYNDKTGDQLNDGVFGGTHWSDDLGQGGAHEWVGWSRAGAIKIDFAFDGTQTFDTVLISTIQDTVSNVVRPSAVLFALNANGDWDAVDDEFNSESADNAGRYTINFADLNVTTTALRVMVYESLDGPWTFLDEVSFYQTTSQMSSNAASTSDVPVGLAGLLPLLGLACFRRKKKTK
jgi:hypothetical protein